MQSGFYDYVSSGFVVLATQYRGVDGGEGQEEFGGAKVRDVLNLVPLARSLGYVDTDNVFLLGWSRGGMEALLALKAGLAVNAAAVGGPALDLEAEIAARPAMATVLAELVPGYAERPQEVIRERSAMRLRGRRPRPDAQRARQRPPHHRLVQAALAQVAVAACRP